jgi:predicted NBD/HSP70 family sugar kinase
MDQNQTALGIDVGGTSVKLAAVAQGQILWTAKAPHHKPSAQELLDVVAKAAEGRARGLSCVGLCVPGILDERRERVTFSANVPALHDLRLEQIARAATEEPPTVLRVVNDTIATAWDVFTTRKVAGRMLVLALGTGVGAAVLDDGVPLRVDGDSPGHIGQIDVSLEGEPIIGPDGGAGGLEGYIGAAALRQRYGPGAVAARLHAADPPIRALVRALRICHALYRPQHIVLAGGIGFRLGHLIAEMREAINKHLTRIARPDWTLSTADHDHHAAAGAAKLARPAGAGCAS